MAGSVIIHHIGQLVTPKGTEGKYGHEMSRLHIIEDGAIVITDGLIQDVGSTKRILASYGEANHKKIDAKGKTVTPGFIDSHTHFIFGGDRSKEYLKRLSGASYMEIMKMGGGILSTVKATREATFESLLKSGRKRLDGMLKFGVTTVEGKSGYGLESETELKQLRVMEHLNKEHGMDIVTTYMGAHALPQEYKGKKDDFIGHVMKAMKQIKEEELAKFCDVFCEEGVFSLDESEMILKEAKNQGLLPKIHADEIVALGGAELGAKVGAVSADHLLQISERGIEALIEKEVVATLLPCTAFTLREPYAPARRIIDAGGCVALASDFNPGSSPTYSIPLIIALATLEMQMTMEEVLTALTLNGAAALDLAHEIGSIEIGKKGDILIHGVSDYQQIPYQVGMSTVETVIKEGQVL